MNTWKILARWPAFVLLGPLGFDRCDMALWVLDLGLAEPGLASEQTFALRLVRVYLSHDSAALEQLRGEQLLTFLRGG